MDDEDADDDLIEEETHKGRTVHVRRSACSRDRQRESLRDCSMNLWTKRDFKNVEENTHFLEEPGNERTRKFETDRTSQNIPGTGHEKDAIRHGSLGQVSCFGAKDGEEPPFGTGEPNRG